MESFKTKDVMEHYASALRALYGDSGREAAERIANTMEEFFRVFGMPGKPDSLRLFSAPGRTEIGGNHTDHQRGCVLAMAVDLDVIGVAAATNSNTVRIYSDAYGMDTVDLDDRAPDPAEYGRSAALVRGVAEGLRRGGFSVGGFDAVTFSQVPKGSGLSSSAAYEVLLGAIFNGLYNDGNIGAEPIAQTAQFAEKEYFGKPCGLMDQMASSVGGLVFMDFKEQDKPFLQPLEYDFNTSGYTICVVNTGGDHADLTGCYAAVTREMSAVSALFGHEVLSQVEPSDFYGRIAEVRSHCGDRAVLRAGNFFEENERVRRQREALEAGDFRAFKNLVLQSGAGSFQYLQNVVAGGDGTHQELALGLFLSEQLLRGRGAWRVHGGGFAGTIQAYVPADLAEHYRMTMESVFGAGSCHMLHERATGGCEIQKNEVK